MPDPNPKHRWFHPAPAWLIYGLLVVVGLLWLSERYRWFGFNSHKGWTVLVAVAVVAGAMLVMLLWFVVSMIFRWRFQFSIRSLLVLVVAVAVPCSWPAVEMKAAREQRASVEEVKNMHGDVIYDWQVDSGGNLSGHSKPPEPAWLLNLLGEDFFEAVVELRLWNPLGPAPITDTLLERIKGLNELHYLWLENTEITDNGLEYVAGLMQLQSLDLGYTNVTDKGLEKLRGLTELQTLGLRKTQITDTGLQQLAGLSRLRWLDLEGTSVTTAGVKKLKQALPNCEINAAP
jgi:hypothetical protein